MAISLTNNQYYGDIANAIRQKNQSITRYKPFEMANAIALIETSSDFVMKYKTEEKEFTKNTSITFDTGLSTIKYFMLLIPGRVAMSINGLIMYYIYTPYGSEVCQSNGNSVNITSNPSFITISGGTVLINPHITNDGLIGSTYRWIAIGKQ